MKTHDLKKLLEAVPYDSDVHIKNTETASSKANSIFIDFEKKEIVIGCTNGNNNRY